MNELKMTGATTTNKERIEDDVCVTRRHKMGIEIFGFASLVLTVYYDK